MKNVDLIKLAKACIIMLVFPAILCAGDDDKSVKFDAQIRVRTEIDGRDMNSSTPMNTFSLLRARLGAAVSPAKNIDIYFQIQDARAFGTEPSTISNTMNLDAHQAYFQINKMWRKPLSLRAGRTELSYGDERLVGAVAWNNIGRSFDGLLMKIGKKRSVDIFATILNQTSNIVLGTATPEAVEGKRNESSYFMGAVYEHRVKKGYKVDAYALYQLNLERTNDDDKQLNRLTIGTYNKGTFSESLAFQSEFAYQLGKRRAQTVSAYMIAPSLGYIFQGGKKPSIWVEYALLSGMKSGDDKYKVFDTMFATNHKFYGFMDYFLNIPVDTDGRGLADFVVKGIIPLSKKWTLKAFYHNLAAGAGGGGGTFGNEIDVTLDYHYNKNVLFYGGVSIMLPGELLKQKFENEDAGFWAFITFEAKIK